MSELVGNVGLIVNVAALFLVGIGVVGRRGSRKTLLRHGYLSIVGLVLKLVTVIAAMIPPLLTEFPLEMQEFSILHTSVFWAKIALGTLGTIMGFICIVPWLLKHCEENSCLSVKKWMWPTMIVWTLSVVFGAIIHLGGII